jgi:phosphoesterase RecJ-like protein
MELTEAVYFDLPRSYIEALGKSLYSLQFLGDGRLALMEYLDRDEIEDAEGFIDFAIGVKGVKSAVFIRSMEDGRFKVSLRARDSLDVREIAESYGGGGHTKAAGFRFRGSLDQLKFDLIRKILERLG